MNPDALALQLSASLPVADAPAAQRIMAELTEAAEAAGWRDLLEPCRPLLEGVFGASPYLAGLVRRRPDSLRETLAEEPGRRLASILEAVAALEGDPDQVRAPLRRLKSHLHLLTALCDLGALWSLDQVTAALSDFADQVVTTALAAQAVQARAQGRLVAETGAEGGPVPGLFLLALGKHGARELNYSSDIDVSVFYEPARLQAALAPGQEAQAFADRLAGGLARLLSERSVEGYVFRVDLRLRPDPASTPPAVPAPAALNYYETVGQNWERAAFIKARPLAGDLAAAADFLAQLRPFIWRRSLDYDAIDDIQSIKRQIHARVGGEGIVAPGADLKLGQGGIREIEFFVQTQQLILGGRDRRLRRPRTLDALAALAEAGHVEATVAAELTDGYDRLRTLEHRVQMLDDDQTHTLPADPQRRAAVAALTGDDRLDRFDRAVTELLERVNGHYAGLFPGAEPLSSVYGSLVFTGVDDDPETLRTLARMGFTDPVQVSKTVRGWHHGRIPATRTARGRELWTRLGPRLLDACAATGAADPAFTRFGLFFEGLKAGIQVQSLFLAQPDLLDTLVATLAYAPRLAATLARRAGALDAVMDAGFFRPLDAEVPVGLQIEAGLDFESAMNAVRREHCEQAFRIGLQVLSGRIGGEAAGSAHTALAQATVDALAPAALTEVERLGGALDGQVAVVALGKFGSGEMTARSDMDLMTVYEAAPEALSSLKGWSPDLVYGRFTQRLIAALSAHTAEGGLYEVDMRLRPSGTAGPVAVSLKGFADYYAAEAATWEFLALTRARVVWASSPGFATRITSAIEAALRSLAPDTPVRADAVAMRALMMSQRPPRDVWDMKHSPGGQVDCEFIAQTAQLLGAGSGGPLRTGTLAALNACGSHDPALAEITGAAGVAWAFQQELAQVIAVALVSRDDVAEEPRAFTERLARRVGVADTPALIARLEVLRLRARAAFEALMT